MRIEDYTAEELFHRLNELDECDVVEAKAFSKDSSRSILETVCSLSNEPGLGGGVILLGVAENPKASEERYFVEALTIPTRRNWISRHSAKVCSTLLSILRSKSRKFWAKPYSR